MVSTWLLGSPGCATQPQIAVAVDGITTKTERKLESFVLRSGMQDVAESDLEFREFASYIERALLDHGFLRIDDEQAADLVIYMSYGIGILEAEPYTRARPQIGVGGNVVRADAEGGTRVSYFQYLRLDALDQRPQEDGEAEPVWKTTITSNADSADLRRIFPVLVGAASPYLGRNTGHRVLVHLSEDDERVKRLR